MADPLTTAAPAPVPAPSPAPAPAPGQDPTMLQSWYTEYLKNTPETATVTPDANSTVAGQVAKITAQDSPLNQVAQTNAKQTAAARGLLNSSIAATAGQKALYDSALPIAQQDAATFADAAKFNASAKNTALTQQRDSGITGFQQEKGFEQQSKLQAADIANQQEMQSKDLASRYDLASLDANTRLQLQQADAENQQKLQAANAVLQTGLQANDLAVKQSMQEYQLAVQQSMADKDNTTKLQLATLDANTQLSLAQIEQQYKTQLQTSQSMAASYQSLVQSITQIMLDPNLDAAAKATAIENQRVLFNNTLALQSDISGLNLGELIPPGTFQAPANSGGGGGGGGGSTEGPPSNITPDGSFGSPPDQSTGGGG